MSILSSGQQLDVLRRRRDFLAERIRQFYGDPGYDKSEHSALTWVIRYVEDRRMTENPQIKRNLSNPGRAESRDLQESAPGVPTKPSKLSSMVPCSRYRRRESAR